MKDYIVDVVFATREPAQATASRISADYIEYGASPRATIALTLAARAHAFLRHRGFVTPEDVKAVGLDVLRHRVIAHLRGRGRGAHRRRRSSSASSTASRSREPRTSPDASPGAHPAHPQARDHHPQGRLRDMLAGQYHSVFKGRGMAFSEVRQYQPGDEIRIIDWNVTARMNDAVREGLHRGARADGDAAGGRLGVGGLRLAGAHARREIAAEVAAQIAFSAIANNDRVGLILFSDRVEKVIPPKKGRKHVLRLVSDILSFQPQGRGTDLAAGPRPTCSRVAKRKAVTFLDLGLPARRLREARSGGSRAQARPRPGGAFATRWRRHFPSAGPGGAGGPGDRTSASSSTPATPLVRRRVRTAAMAGPRQERTRLFKKLELDHVELRAGEDHGEALVRFFRARARRLAA